ncbi:hypothetical protein DMUE_2890 [Dictyocoela muelleri]|nr:hypothetical protein DMUE_2890 [Dictyocoela muelleri]
MAVYRVISGFNKLIPAENFQNNKMGGPGILIQIDETMLNFKAKTHRGRSPSNRTDVLCIVKTNNNIIRAFAQTIPNKKASTLIPIIIQVVPRQSIILTDEHKSYSSLSSM